MNTFWGCSPQTLHRPTTDPPQTHHRPSTDPPQTLHRPTTDPVQPGQGEAQGVGAVGAPGRVHPDPLAVQPRRFHFSLAAQLAVLVEQEDDPGKTCMCMYGGIGSHPPSMPPLNYFLPPQVKMSSPCHQLIYVYISGDG